MANLFEQIRSRSAPLAPQPAGLALGAGLVVAWSLAVVLWGGDLSGWSGAQAGHALLATAGVLALCLIPGLALLEALWGSTPLPWPERLAVAGGIGAGLPALLLMAARLVHLPWPPFMTVAYLGLSVLALCAALVRQRRSPRAPLTRAGALTAGLLAGMTVLALLARLYVVRDLLVGPNVDSYHHTLIAQLLVERQGLFSDWAPYAALNTFTYHYGFHALVAWTHVLTGVPITLLVPLVGQVMNAAMVPMLYALTVRLTGRPMAGVWAALLVGFVNMQPAYYVFWGRGPFVMSHALVVAALICWMAAIEAQRLRPGLIALSAIVCAALAHTHYQATIFTALFLAVYLLLLLLRAPSLQAMRVVLGRAAAIGALALALALPWLLTTLGGHLGRNVAYNSALQSGEAFPGLQLPPLAPLFLHPAIIALSVVGLVAAARLRRWRLAMPAAWGLVSMLSAFPYIAGLPGTGMIEPAVAPMVLYISIIPLAAYGLYGAQRLIEQAGAMALRPRLGAGLAQLVLVAAVVAVSVAGLGWQRTLVPPYDRMVTSADMAAFEWVRASTPPDARFLVHSHPIYAGAMIVGTDAGWWLPLLAARQTNVPPLPYGSERSVDPNYPQQVAHLAEVLRRKPLSDLRGRGIDLSLPEAQQALRDAGITYVYIGAQPLQGAGTLSVVDRIDTDKLRDNPAFRRVYARDGVEIYQFVAGS
jgi:hypothetical protein